MIWGRTSGLNSDLCDRQAPGSSFHTEEQQELPDFNWAFWSYSKESLVVVGALGQPDTQGVAAWSPGMLLLDALGAPGVCTSPHRVITATRRTGHRYPWLNRA